MDATIRTIARIAEREFRGPSLMGQPLMPYLRSLAFEKAAYDGTTEGYTAWGVALHLLYHKHLTIQLIGGDDGLAPFPYEAADWPSLPERRDPTAWRLLLDELEAMHARFIAALGRFPMSRWDELLPAWSCTVGQVLDCMACHDLYHVAQMRNMGL